MPSDFTKYSYSIPLDENFDGCNECRAEFWIQSNRYCSIDLEQTLQLGKYKSIAPKSTRKPGPFKGSFAISSDIEIKSRDLRHHLNWLCNVISTFSGLDDLQEDQQTLMSVNCYWYAKHSLGVTVLWPEQLRFLADLNIEFVLNYIYEGEEAE